MPISSATEDMMDDDRRSSVGSRVARARDAQPSPSPSPPSRRAPVPVSRQRHGRRRRRPRSPWLLCLGLVLASCLTMSSALPHVYIDEQMVDVETRDAVFASSASTLQHLARSGPLWVDGRPAGEAAKASLPVDVAGDLRRRREDAGDLGATTPAKESSASSKLAPTTADDGAAAAGDDAYPVPFDTGFNNNVTEDCNAFMSRVLTDPTFNKCLPFSMLLRNSISFFQTTKSFVRITQTLDRSCAADVSTCSALMSHFAGNMTLPSTCAGDLQLRNPLIEEAFLGLTAYKTLYTASCLRHPVTSAYCFANAITNTSSPADSYIYFLPLNVSLVGGSQPTCDACLHNTMAVFEAASADRSQAVATTYVSAAMQVNVHCGPTYVNSSLAQAVLSAAVTPTASPASMGGLALVAILASWLF